MCFFFFFLFFKFMFLSVFFSFSFFLIFILFFNLCFRLVFLSFCIYNRPTHITQTNIKTRRKTTKQQNKNKNIPARPLDVFIFRGGSWAGGRVEGWKYCIYVFFCFSLSFFLFFFVCFFMFFLFICFRLVFLKAFYNQTTHIKT